MSQVLGLIGILAVFAGLHLLWSSRQGFFYWLETYLRTFLRLLREPEARRRPLTLDRPSQGEPKALPIVIGMVLVFLIGPVLIVLSLAL